MPCSIWLSSVARPLQELLVVTDGWAAYPKSIRRVFREKARSLARQGRCRLLAWPGLLIGTVIKRTERKHVVEVVRRMAASVWRNEPSSFSPRRKRGNVLHTSFIERINGTFRERLASLTRRCRHASHSVEMLEARDVACWLYLQLLLAPLRARADNGNRT
jgi:IS1 family transposase